MREKIGISKPLKNIVSLTSNVSARFQITMINGPNFISLRCKILTDDWMMKS